MAGSPLDDYSVGVALYVLLIGFLVSVLLIGGILVVNIGLMSKSEEDKIGARTPSDVGILKQVVWPEQRDIPHEFPETNEEVAGVTEIIGPEGLPSQRVVERKKAG